MKTKTLFFSNFKFNQTNNFNENELTIENLSNANTNFGYISSEFSFIDTIETLINDKEKLQTIYNFNENILQKTIKIIPYQFISDLDNEFYSRIFLLTSEYNLYELNNETNLFEFRVAFNENPNIIFSEDVLYFLKKSGECVIFVNINSSQTESLPKLKTFTKNSKELFFTTNDYPYFIFKSELCQIKNLSSNLEQYERIKVNIEDGAILKIVRHKDNVFIFTKYSIFKYDEDKEQLIKLCNLKLEIFENTISSLDDEFVFFASSGLYKFDGTDCEKIINNYLNFSKNANSFFFNQNLYIISPNHPNFLYKFNFEDKYFYPLQIFNLVDFYIIKDNDNYSLCVSAKKQDSFINITLSSNGNGMYPLQIAKFKPSNLKTISNKILRNIFVRGEGKFTLKIQSEISSAVFNINGETKLHNICLSGNCFEFEINANSYFKLKSIAIEFEEVE